MPTTHSIHAGESSLIYAVATALALLLLVVLFNSSRTIQWRRRRVAGRSEKPIGHFVKEAKAVGISLRVAREAYDLLRHHYPRPMCVDLNDDLRRDLRMSPENIPSLRSGLLGRTDRVEEAASSHEEIATVRDLLLSIEAAPSNGVDRAAMRQRVSDQPFSPRPAVENLEFTGSSSLADPDFLRRAHFKWLRRRTSDYKGFRSRETDDLSGQEHIGPFRRGTELSRRLAVKEDAGRRAKLAAETGVAKGAVRESRHDPPVPATVYQGY